jgi:cytochrome oxidase Cu insertion factor (SCO1/SenC/PrrC family)
MAALERSLGPASSVHFVAVAANPRHYGLSDIRHFIARRHLDAMHHFVFATGPLPTLRAIWHNYGIGVSSAPKGQMSVHSNYLFVIDAHGILRYIVPDEPLSSWSGENAAVSELRRVLADVGVA